MVNQNEYDSVYTDVSNNSLSYTMTVIIINSNSIISYHFFVFLTEILSTL